MSAANPIVYGQALRPQQPFMSEWRRSFGEYRQQQKAAPPRPQRASSAPAAAVHRMPRKRIRTAAPKPRRVREAKIVRHCATADCGGRVRGREVLCTRCLRASNGVTDDMLCARGCGNRLGLKNRSGMCDVCLRADQRARKLGARPTCSHVDPDSGRRCLEILMRDNRTGVCGWHHPKFSKRAQFRGTSPRMTEVHA